MTEEQPGELPEELREWLDERAEETGRSREEELSRAVAAYRLVSSDETQLSNGADLDVGQDLAEIESALSRLEEGLEALEEARSDAASTREEMEATLEQLETVEDRVQSLDARLDGVEDDLDEHVSDLRDRVVQVMQTARSKADSDHTHEELERRLTRVSGDLDGLEDRFEELEERVDGGFENYETILERLTDDRDELDEKATKLAHAVIDLRGRLSDLEADEARRAAVADIKTEANRVGAAAATCQDCETKVRVGLLTDPNCPHCGSVFDGVEPAGSFLGSATLTVGERPALEGGSSAPSDPEAVFEEDDG